MRFTRLVALLSLTFALAGCINSSTLIKVKPDGSGTIEQILLMNMSMLKGMMAGVPGQDKQASPFSEEQLKQAADRLGKGVRFVSSAPMAQGGFEGAKAVYAFDDITQVSIEQDPNVGGSSTQGMAMRSKTSNPVRFSLTREGPSSVLTVTFDEKAVRGNASPGTSPVAPDNVDPATLQMMKSIFQGFKVAIDLEVLGKIVKTNADYVDGSRITLMEIDMASLLEDEAKLRALQPKVAGGASIAEIKPLLKDVKGVKINHAVVTVEYR